MIKQIFKIIWNERRTNLLIFVQYLVVFVVLWFCFDYMYYMTRMVTESHGYDIDHVYLIEMKQKQPSTVTAEEKYELARTFEDRVLKYPGVESMSFSWAAVPYGLRNRKNQYYINGDTTVMHNVDVREVTPSFFDVFKVKVEHGRIFNPDDNDAQYQVMLSPDKKYRFGNKDASHPVAEVKSLTSYSDRRPREVVGITERQKNNFFDPHFNGVYFSYRHEQLDLARSQLAIRVSPEADKDFVARFRKDMKQQLQLGPYYLSSVTSLSKMRSIYERFGYTDSINSMYAVTLFLMLNVFLCIIGTFWFRTQARRNEIGLRIALGSSKRKVRAMLYAEAFQLLLLASIPAAYICLNLGGTELISSLGIPTADRVRGDIGWEQDIINYVLTFAFLAVITALAIWYPARLSTNMSPAEALREE